MKKLAFIAFVLFTSSAFAQDVYVHGYTRQNGTYVQPYHRSAPDGNPYNNYSTQGNVNPYTGQPGYVSPGYNPPQPYSAVQQPAPQEYYPGLYR